MNPLHHWKRRHVEARNVTPYMECDELRAGYFDLTTTSGAKFTLELIGSIDGDATETDAAIVAATFFACMFGVVANFAKVARGADDQSTMLEVYQQLYLEAAKAANATEEP